MDAAKGSYGEVECAAALRDVRVSEVISGKYVIVNREVSLEEFVDMYRLTPGRRCFAVEDQGRLTGLITLRDLSRFPQKHWDAASANGPRLAFTEESLEAALERNL